MSIVQICNRGASQYLGLGRINSLEEGSPQAEQYELHYNDLRRSLLEKHWWTFAKTRQALALGLNDRKSEWAFKYNRPAGVVDIHWVNDPTVARYKKNKNDNPDCDRETSGQSIYCDVPLCYIEFTRDEENTDIMPQYFKDALSAMIAAAVAMPLTESVNRAKFAAEQAQIMIDIAIAEDEQNAPPIRMPDADYIDARGAADNWNGSR